MRYMMLLKANKRTEAGELPTAEDLAIMGKYNAELIKAGVLLDGAGLQSTAKGARITFKGGRPQVTDGPFTGTKEIIAGYWIIQVKSKEEAIAWAVRCPLEHIPQNDGTGEIELRRMFEREDFPDVPPAVAEMEASRNSRS
jgi:hypothetical protein